MRTAAVVSLLWPKNFGVLETFVRDNPGTLVYTLPELTDPDLTRRIADAGGELRTLDEVLSADELAASGEELSARLSRVETVLGGEAWSKYAADHGWSGERLGAIVARRASADLPGVAHTLAALGRVRSEHIVRLVVVNEDWTPECRAVVLWARHNGVPSLHLSHALELCEQYTVHERVVSDVMAIFGDRGADVYLDDDAATPAGQMRVTGNPAWDAYPELVSRREAVRAALAADHGLAPSPPWVVFATTWVSQLTALSDEGAFAETLRDFLQACKTLLDAGRRIEAVVKDRPPNRAFGSARLAELVDELALDGQRVHHVVDDIDRWIVAADAVVSVGSNVSVEAMLAGTPAIDLVTEMDVAHYPPFDAGTGIVQAEGHDLAPALERILGDPDHRDRLREQMRQAAACHNLGCDGGATTRVAQLMQELALPDDKPEEPAPPQAEPAPAQADWERWLSETPPQPSDDQSAPARGTVGRAKELLAYIRLRYRYPLIVLRAMVATDFKLRYQASLLGYLWTLLRPLALFSILYIVFVRFLRLGNQIPYNAVYLLFGLVLWGFFTETTSQGLSALVARADLLRKIAFPRYVVVLSIGGSVLIGLFLNMLVIALFMVLLGVPVRWDVLWLPLLFVELVALSVSLAFFLSALYVRFRDLNYIWEVTMQAAFYITPIIYPLTLVPTRWARLLVLSPIAQIIQDARYVLVTDQTETISQLYSTPWVRVIPVGITLILVVTSVVYFRRQSASFAEGA